MAGQQNLRVLSQDNYEEYFLSQLLQEADKFYLHTKFNIETNYSRHKRRHAQLYYSVVTNPTCELAKWICKKLQGKLEDENIKIVDLDSLQTVYKDTIINNYYVEANYEDVQW